MLPELFSFLPKRIQRELIDLHVREYLGGGGAITRVPVGVQVRVEPVLTQRERDRLAQSLG